MTNLAEFRKNPLLQLEYSLATGRSLSNLSKRSGELHGNIQFHNFLSQTSSTSSPINWLNENNYLNIYTSVLKRAAKEISELELVVGITFTEILDKLRYKHDTSNLNGLFTSVVDKKWGNFTKGELKPLLLAFQGWQNKLNTLNLGEDLGSAQLMYDFLDKPVFKQLKKLSEVVEVISSNWNLDKCVFENIIEKLNSSSPEFIKGWLSKGHYTGHFNAISHYEYKSLYSWIFLDFVTQSRGYTSHLWATKSQWLKKGFKIKEGADWAPVFHYFKVYEDVEDNGYIETKLVNDFGRKISIVYNSDEVVDYTGKSFTESKVVPLEVLEHRIQILEIQINREGYQANYNRVLDCIEMPRREFFKSKDSTKPYYSALLHEMIHWTGHETRLNRTFGSSFGDADYAFEELVAEIGSAFLCSRFNLNKNVNMDSIAYIQDWLSELDSNKTMKFLTNAASLANRACNFIYTPQRDDKVKNVYTVEISAECTIELFHIFTKEELADADGRIAEAFNNLLFEIENEISDNSIVIQFANSSRRNIHNKYKLSVFIQRCFPFDEKDIDGEELVDGSFDVQLNDMKTVINEICSESAFEIEVVNFQWTHDEIVQIETITNAAEELVVALV